jgi:hypothetical protein
MWALAMGAIKSCVIGGDAVMRQRSNRDNRWLQDAYRQGKGGVDFREGYCGNKLILRQVTGDANYV